MANSNLRNEQVEQEVEDTLEDLETRLQERGVVDECKSELKNMY